MYTTKEVVLGKLGQFSEMIKESLSGLDVDAFIKEADTRIDGYIIAAVSLPFVSVPQLITTISTDIAVRNLWAQTQAKSLPEHVKQDYETAIKNLVAIAKGTLKINADDANSESFSDLKHAASKRTFKRDL